MARRSVTFLWAGAAAPIVFTTVYLVDGATRTGYDPLRHQVSLLELGDRGWLMTVNFLVTGVLLFFFAAGVRAWLRDGPGALATPVAIGAAGMGLLLAGIFPTQPLFGYPPGTPEGMATDVTPASVAHLLGAFLLIFGLIAAALSFAVRAHLRMSESEIRNRPTSDAEFAARRWTASRRRSRCRAPVQIRENARTPRHRGFDR